MITYKIVIFISMLLLHIIEDFHLQGILASMKQKKWWEKELSVESNPDIWKKYKNDYKISLLVHSIENSIFILLPCIIDSLIYTIKVDQNNSLWMLICFLLVFNTIVHYIIDNCKCNELIFNLIVDQIVHLCSIIICFSSYWKYLGGWL